MLLRVGPQMEALSRWAAVTLTPLIVLIVTFGLGFVMFAALAAGMTTTAESVIAPIRGNALPTLGLLVANFVLVPLLTGLTLRWFGFTAQATMAFALLSVVAGAPFVAMFTKLGHGDVQFAAAVSFLLLVVTIPFMPFVLPWMLGVLHVPHAPVTTWHLLKPMLWFLVIPLAIGFVVRWRYPGLAQELAPRFSQVALVSIALHVTLMFVAYWNQVVAELGTGEYLYSVFMPVGCALVGYGSCVLFMRGGARAEGGPIELPAALATGQKGSQALICSLIFAMGTFPVAGVVALGSSVITLVILVIGAAEIGKRLGRRPLPEATSRPAVAQA